MNISGKSTGIHIMMKCILTAGLLFVLLFNGSRAYAQQYNIKNYGAKGDGTSINTKPLQAAIDSCYKNGGGEVVIPAGIFITGTIHLKSNVNLFLASGAILKGSPSLDDYEIFTPDKPFKPVHKGMLFTEDAENITISGSGQVDGNGDLFFDTTKAKKIDRTGTQYTRQKDNFRKVESGIGDGPIVPKERPYQMFVFSNCRRITVKDIFITQAPFWTMLFADCDAVNVTGIRLWTNILAPNADGIDITSCTNVIISGCDIRSGDDAIAITGYDHHFEIPGFRHLRHISENIIVSDCNLQSYSSGIRIGFLDQNTVRNIHFSNVNITNSTRGIGIFLRDEGSLENMTFSDIYIETKLRTGDWWGNGEPIHISAIRGKENVKLGSIKNIQFTNIICSGENGILLYGTAESILKNISFNKLTFNLTNSKLNETAGGNIDLRGCIGEKNQLFASNIPGLLAQYIDGLTINDFTLNWVDTKFNYFTHGIEVNHFKNISINKFNGTAAPNNSKAYTLALSDGSSVITDINKGLIVSKNVK